VDYRIYLPTLMTDFQDRGGRIDYRAISVADLTELAAEYDLVIIGTGAGGLGQLFARDERSSPFSEPQRHLCVGLFKGIAEPETRAVTFGISPGAGNTAESNTEGYRWKSSAFVIMLCCNEIRRSP
jgi:styrene monooxygenase